MKLQRIVFISLMLQVVAPLHASTASNLVTSLNQAVTNLSSYQQALATLLGTPPNNTSSTDIAPTAINAPAYIASAVNNPPANTPPANGPVVINSNIRADWQPQATSSYIYKNATTIPLVVVITNGTMSNGQQVDPGQTYTQTIAPATSVTVKAHANVSSIKTSYVGAASYTLTLNANNELSLTQTAATGNTLTNSCGWPMLISFIATDNTQINTTLQDGQRYQPTPASQSSASNTNPIVGISVIPLILDQTSNPAAVASCTIANTNGTLALQFAA